MVFISKMVAKSLIITHTYWIFMIFQSCECWSKLEAIHPDYGFFGKSQLGDISISDLNGKFFIFLFFFALHCTIKGMKF